MRDPYLYPDSDVLKNLSDIHDMGMLKNMEADYTSFRLSEVVMDNTERQYNFEALCNMHYNIFQDVYEWAGKPRVINIEKAEIVLGEISVEYSDCFDIVKDAEQVLDEMNHYDWQNASFENVVRKFSDYMAKLWRVHPYREGNTRTVEDCIRTARLLVTQKNIRKIIFWNRKGYKEHSIEEIRNYLRE